MNIKQINMYKYWSKVKVTSWFYEGMEGEIGQIETNPITLKSRYMVLLNMGVWSKEFIPESNLELIK